MAALSGTAGSVVYTTGTDYSMAEVSEWTLDLSNTVIDVTAFGETTERYITNIARATGAFVGNFDAADTGQVGARAGLQNGAPIRLLLYYSSADFVDALSANVTGYSPTVTVDGKADVSYDFQVTGRIDTSAGMDLLLQEDDDLLLLEDGSGIRIDVIYQW